MFCQVLTIDACGQALSSGRRFPDTTYSTGYILRFPPIWYISSTYVLSYKHSVWSCFSWSLKHAIQWSMKKIMSSKSRGRIKELLGMLHNNFQSPWSAFYLGNIDARWCICHDFEKSMYRLHLSHWQPGYLLFLGHDNRASIALTTLPNGTKIIEYVGPYSVSYSYKGGNDTGLVREVTWERGIKETNVCTATATREVLSPLHPLPRRYRFGGLHEPGWGGCEERPVRRKFRAWFGSRQRREWKRKEQCLFHQELRDWLHP